MFAAAPAPLFAAVSPIATYAFDEGSGTFTADLSGSGNNGTLTNGPTWTAGKYGNALSFNASDDGNDSNDPRVVLGRTFVVPNLPLTFEAWVNPASYADWRAILSKRDASSASAMRLDVGLAGGSGRVYVATGATFRSFLYSPTLNTWTHLAVVADAAGTKLYVNGTLRETIAAITLGTGTNANTVIGGTGEGAGGDNDPYKGLLDDLRLYDRALTQTEIQTDMNTPAGTPDQTPPGVSLTAPAAGSVSGSSVTVSANASDNIAVVGVQFQLDGAALGAEDTVAPYSIVWNSVSASDGSHTLTAVARDAAGNSTTSAGLVVTVSNPPTLSITQPTGGSTIGGSTVNVSYVAGGNLTGVDHVHFVLDANPQVMDLTFDGSYQLTNVAAGSHVLNGFLVRANHSKILGTDAAPVSFTTTAPDTIPPTVSITSPAALSSLSGTVTITANAGDDTGVVGVQFRVGALNITPEDTTAPFSVSFNTTSVPNGTQALMAVARDAAGNHTTSASVSVTVANTNTTLATYAFDEGAGTITADLSGHGLTGTLTNGPTWVAGKYGNALSFNATDDGNDANDPRVVLGRTFAIPNLPLTFEAWVDPASYADWRAIISKRDSPAASNMRLDLGLSGGSGRVYLAAGTAIRSFLYSPTLNTWTHLAVVADAGGTKLYVNGTLRETLAAITLGTGTNANTVIGGTGEGAGGDNDPYKGLLDDIRLYDRALTAGEIQTDMNTPAGAPDSEAPVVSLTAPAAGAVSGSGVTVSANATDNIVVAGVQFRIDGTNLGAEDTVAPFSMVWNSALTSDGAHTLTAVARDATGNIATSTGVAVTISNPPTLTITQPAIGSTISGTTVNVSYVAAGNLTGVDHVHFTLDGNPDVMDITFDGSYQFVTVSAGAHVLGGYLVNQDHVKLPGTDAAPVSFTTTVADTISPTVSITAPAASSTLSGTVTLTANAGDNSGVFGVQFRIGAVNIIPEDTTAPYSVSLNTTSFPNGPYTLTAVARDAAGNQTTSVGVPVTVSNLNPNDPALVGQWTAPVVWPNVAVHLSYMSDGNFLTWDDHTTDGGAHVYDPTTGTFTPVTYNAANLFCSGHTALPDGRILVNGGHAAAYVGINSTVLFSPATKTWAAVAPMTYARWYPTTITLSDGRVLTVSGAIDCPDCKFPGSPDAGVADVPEIYNPATNTWSQLNSAVKNLPIYPHMFLLPDGKIIATSTQEDPIATFELDINTQTWTTVDPNVVDGGSTVMYLPGKFMKSGAAINADYPALPANASTHVLDMTTSPSSWRQTAPMAFPRTQHNLTILPDGNVLVTGGSRNSNVFDQSGAVFEAELWSPSAETYTTLAGNVTPRLYHSTALLLADGRVLSAGGGRFGPSQLSGEFYSPPYLFKGPRPAITAAPATTDYGTSFAVTTPDGGRIAKVSLIRLGSVTHAINTEQRYVPLSFQVVSGGLTVQTPTSRNVVPPGTYMLFIVDTNGVPSVAKFIRFPTPAEDLSAPTAPTNLTATGSVGSASLAWTGSTDNVGVVAYDIHRSASSGFTPSPATKVGAVAVTNYVDAGIPAGTYFYKVQARDAGGNTSSSSNQASATVSADVTPPNTPTGLAANIVSFSRINLTWNVSTDNVGVTGYHLYRDGNLIATTTVPATSNTGLSGSTTYLYTVDAFDAANNTSAPSAPPLSATTPIMPPLALDLKASYPLDEGSGTTTADLSGNGFTGTLTNSPTWVAGKYGNALSFNASDDGNDGNDPRVVLGRTIDVPNVPFTFSAWVNPANYADWRAIISKRDTPAAANMRMDLGLAGGSGRVYVAAGPTMRMFLFSPTLNTWTHIAVVAETGGTKLYVNGNLQESIAAVTLGTGTNANMVIGGTGEGAGGDNDPYKGLLDDLRLYDRALTQGEIQTDMITPAGAPDTVAPVVSMTAPAAGAVTGSAVTVSANATDNIAVSGVQFKLDGVNLGAEDTVAPYSIVWNSTLASDGTHTLTAIGRDAAGNSTTSAGVVVTVSNPPTLSITQPTGGSTVGGSTVNVTYVAGGNLTGVDHVHFVLDANPQVMDLTFDGSYPLTNVVAGAHVLNGFLVRADHSKILGTDAAPVSFTTTAPDTIAPTVSITAPAALSTLSGTVTITANAGDTIGVTGVQFRVGSVNILPEATTAPYSVSFNTTTVGNGTQILTAVARDAAGNQTTSASVTVTVSNTNTTLATYAFDEGSGTTTADLSGHGFTGALTNGPTWVAGKYGTALSFNATDDGNDSNDPRVVLGRTFAIPSLPLTFEAWVNPASFADWRAIISKRDSPAASNMRFDMGLSGGSGRVYIATGSTFRSFAFSPTVNTWTHLAVVADGAGTKLYVDGTLRETLGAIVLGTGTDANTVIGGTGEGAGGDNDPYKGLLDDLRLYDRALTQAEIQSDMNTQAGTTTAASVTDPLAASDTGFESSPPAPAVLRVFPNPFRGTTTIEARSGEEIAIYDVTGRRVRNWKSYGSRTAFSALRVDWDGRDGRGRHLPTGIYFVKSGRQILRVALLR